MLYIIDTYAWVEYLTGSEKGKKVREMLEDSRSRFITIECCLAELNGWSMKNRIDFQGVLKVVEINSEILPVSRDEWINAAIIKSEMARSIKDFGLVDALLIAKQKKLNCRIITADLHFKNLKGIEFLK